MSYTHTLSTLLASSVTSGVFARFKFRHADFSQNEAAAAGDIEAPVESSGIALTNLATDQPPVTGAPPRRAEEQSEPPSQPSDGLGSLVTSSDAALPQSSDGTPAVSKLALGEDQTEAPTRDQGHLSTLLLFKLILFGFRPSPFQSFHTLPLH